jgi:hypothetical protein
LAKTKEERRRLEEQSRVDKEALRRMEVKTKEKLKEAGKLSKERTKMTEKAKQQCRKEATADLKKNRADSQLQVITAFDREEDVEERLALTIVAASNEQFKDVTLQNTDAESKFDQFLGTTAFCAESFKTTVYEEPRSTHLAVLDSIFANYSASADKCRKSSHWDDVFNLSSSLFVFRDYLGFQHPPKVDELLAAVKLFSSHGQQQATAADELVADTVATGLVSEIGMAESKSDTEGLQVVPATVAANSVGHADDRIASQVLLDRMHLRLMQKIYKGLHAMLDLNDAKDAIPTKRSTASTKLKMPLNQLTWPELARQCIVAQLCDELGKSKEETLHLLRGGKNGQYYCTNKNIVRRIRTKLWFRMQQESNTQLQEGITRASIGIREYFRRAALEDARVTFAQSNGNYFRFCGSDDKILIIADYLSEYLDRGSPEHDSIDKETKTGRRLLVPALVERQAPAMQNMFSNESELMSAMTDLLRDNNAPEIYHRCTKVGMHIYT